MDDLPSYFDVVVTGTGLTQAMIAAACARVGKSVFNCDASESYGQEWQTMNWDVLQSWVSRHAGHPPDHQPNVDEIMPEIELLEGERLVRCHRPELIKNVSNISYLCEEPISDSQAASGDAAADPVDQPSEEAGADDLKIQWTPQKFRLESRKFNLDLCPRLLFSRGSMVELLVTSNISRYAEFKAVTRILTTIDDHLIEVPCSRNDIFNCKDVSVVEKRMLMKFMQFCHEFEKFPETYQNYENLPIRQFLTTQNLSPLLQHFVLDAIAMVTEDCPTLEALRCINKFISSCGRFGSTPFLFTLYGSGEMPQAFCRLSAVFGGVYCLKKKIDSVVVDDQNQCVGVVVEGKRINCRFLVTDYMLQSEPKREEKLISRAILISDSSIKPSETDQITFFRIPAKPDEIKNPVYAIETGRSALVAPKGIYVVYLWCDSITDNAKYDLLPVVKKLYNFNPNSESDKPKLLWSLYFNQSFETFKFNDDFPSRIFVTTSPINELEYDFAISEARSLFHKMFPDEEFLPRAPDPNEIVFDAPHQNNDVEMHEPVANNNVVANNNAPVINNENNDIQF